MLAALEAVVEEWRMYDTRIVNSIDLVLAVIQRVRGEK